jgi:hypothetical protein
MKKSKPSIRTNISIAADLKRDMDRVKAPVNWSAIAAQAFRQKLNELAAKRKEQAVSDRVLERIRATTTDDAQGVRCEGRICGFIWAQEVATAAELKRLWRLRQELEADSWGVEGFCPANDNEAFGPGERLFFVISPHFDHDRNAAESFWDAVFARDPGSRYKEAMADDEGEFVIGFLIAASSVWADVKDRL